MKTKLLFASLLLSVTTSFYGQTTYQWQNAANGDLDNPANWSPSGFNPTNAQMVLGVAGSYQVALENDMSARYLVMRGGSGEVTLALGERELTLSSIFQVNQNARLTSGTVEGTLQVGYGVSDKSFVMDGSGTVFSSAAGVSIGRNDGDVTSSGNSLLVSGGATLTSGGSFLIGDNRSGNATSNNSVTVTGVGTSLTAGGLLVGNLGVQVTGQQAHNNRFIISDGANVQVSSVTIARRAPGVTSTAANGNQVIVGEGAAASSLTVAAGVSIGGTGANNILKVGQNGTVTASGGATSINSGAGTSLIIEGGKYLATGQKITAYGNSVIAISQDGTLAAGELDLRSSLNTTGKANVNLTGLTLSTTSKINIAISSDTGFGQINISNALDEFVFAGSLNVTFAEGYQAAAGAQYKLFTFQSAAGEFVALDLPDLAAGLQWNTDQLYTTGTIMVVPEPGTAMLTLTMVGVLAGFKYIKRSAF